MEISEKEFAVIREISNNHLPDQRTIASRTGISLGLTNLIIQKLVAKGYIKVRQLNHKKIQYLLTPKGFAEKTKKSYDFALRTISLIKTIREKIQLLIIEEYKKGAYQFELYGNSELADIADLSFKNLSKLNLKYIRKINGKNEGNKVTLLIQSPETKRTIDLISYISEIGLH